MFHDARCKESLYSKIILTQFSVGNFGKDHWEDLKLGSNSHEDWFYFLIVLLWGWILIAFTLDVPQTPIFSLFSSRPIKSTAYTPRSLFRIGEGQDIMSSQGRTYNYAF